MPKVRVAILGCGGMAGAHARRYKENSDVEIVALSDVSEGPIQKFIERHLADYEPKPKVYTDAARMYAEAKPDAVSIVTPHTLHFEHGMQALEAGAHVLMEKPMVTESAQAHELAKKVKETGKIFTIGYNTPCTPEFRYLRQIVRNKELGKLETVTGWLTQDWKRGTTGTWRQDPKLSGGGQMYDSGAHLFNSLVWTVEQPIAEVLAFVDNLGPGGHQRHRQRQVRGRDPRHHHHRRELPREQRRHVPQLRERPRRDRRLERELDQGLEGPRPGEVPAD